jgi:hypothetical protein
VDCEVGVTKVINGRFIFVASSSGNISFRDPSTLKEERFFKFHAAGISDVDCSGNYMVSTGYSLR